MQYLNQSIKIDVHQHLIAIYISFKFHELRFRGYLVIAIYKHFKSIQGLYLMNCLSQPNQT